MLGWAAVWAALELGDLLVPSRDGGDPQPTGARVVLTVAVGLAVTALAWWSAGWSAGWLAARRAGGGRRTTSEPLVLAGAGVVLAGSSTALLHGTRWGMDGLYSDAGFRTEAVTRFADSAALADYAYRGLPAYYPPLLPWLQGRAADLLGVPGWAVMKPTQLLVCLLVPLLSWLLWRRVVPGRRAAWVAGVVAVATVLPLKPDEWLVLTLVVPWWLEVCRGVRAPGRAPVGAVGHGLVLGGLLLLHTYFFAPLALATALGMALDLLRRRPVHPRPGPGLVTGLVAVVVAAPSWGGPAWLRLQGAASDSLQLRWSPPGFDRPPLPWPTDPRGVLEAVGVLWLLWALGRHRSAGVAGGLLVALVSAYVFMVGGQLLQPGVAVLPEKSDELVEALLAAAGVLGLAELGSGLAAVPAARRRPRSRPVAAAAVVLVAAVAVLAGLVTVQAVHRGVERPAAAAQHTRYPDGSLPAGGAVPPSPRWHAWGVEPGVSGASVAEVTAAWERVTGRPPGSGDVVVSARSDLPATVPVHLFVSWKSIYSHPQGRFEDRLAVLEAVARCGTPACAHRLLRGNDVEPVDGLVLNRDGRGLYASVTVDTFPEAWERRAVRFDDRLFAAPWFGTAQVAGGAVVVPR
ncbi:galactan 5-O-arabinofuranosyltransferase [Nocardioides aurantiacus]|uniref:Galactan 5-O-arabinofuranosyltransferase n=1 Tax=Nocardioides aurantiacus TaxID=86796 RepID=A0A3N2CWP3_9ACTN|nr:galactan 5-O-arabinofuranosyltransferase [Nocardioides aurantiacus]